MLEELFTWIANANRPWPKAQATGSVTKEGHTAGKTAQPLPLRLFPGQVVRALVLETEPGRARVQVDGQTLWAVMKTPLTPGRTVWLEVERLAPAVHFRLLSEVNLSDEEWPQLLQALKLPATDRLVEAVRYLSGHRLPFDARMLRQLHQWRNGSYLDKQGVQAAVHLQMRGFPLRFPLFYAVYHALSDTRQQRASLSSSSALALIMTEDSEPADPAAFRLDRWWKRMLQALRSHGGSSAATEGPSTKGGERGVVLLGHAILQFPLTYGDAWAFYSYPLPPWLPFTGWLQLAVPRERSRRWPPAGHLLLQLNMPYLQTTEIRLFWQENTLALTILTEGALPEDMRREEEERLRTHLARLGFVVRSIQWLQLDEPAGDFRWLTEGVDVRC